MANNILALPNPLPLLKMWQIGTSCRRLWELVDPEMCQRAGVVIPRLLRDHHDNGVLLNRLTALLDEMEEPVTETGLNELELLLNMLEMDFARMGAQARIIQAEVYALIRELRNGIVIVEEEVTNEEEEEVDENMHTAEIVIGGDFGSHVLSFGLRCLVLFCHGFALARLLKL